MVKKEEQFYYPISLELGSDAVGYVLLTPDEAIGNGELPTT